MANSSKHETTVCEIQLYIRTQPKRASIEGRGILTGGGAAFKILKQSVGLWVVEFFSGIGFNKKKSCGGSMDIFWSNL